LLFLQLEIKPKQRRSKFILQPVVSSGQQQKQSTKALYSSSLFSFAVSVLQKKKHTYSLVPSLSKPFGNKKIILSFLFVSYGLRTEKQSMNFYFDTSPYLSVCI
jgi:hypothetical protein